MKKAFLLLLLLFFSFLYIIEIPKVYAEPDKSITYNPSTNIITAIGGNETDPINFNDLWLADKDDYLILDQENHTSSPDTFTLDQQMRTTDKVALSLYIGLIFDDPILDTCDITIRGYGVGDFYKEESWFGKTASFDTAYYNDYWSSVINITIAFTGNWLETSIVQWQWGVVWKTGDSQFMFDARIILGNGTVAGTTYFNDREKQITFTNNSLSANSQRLIEGKRYSHLTLGQLDDETDKLTSKGCQFIKTDSFNYTRFIYFGSYNPDINLYSCHFISTGNYGNYGELRSIQEGTFRIWNCILNNVEIVGTGSKQGYATRLEDNFRHGITYSTGTWDKMDIYECYYGVYVYSSYESTYQNFLLRENTRAVRAVDITTDKYLLNFDVDTWNFYWQGTSTAEIYRQYEFDLNVTDIEGSPIQNANVTVSHYGENAGVDFTVLTGANGSFSTKTLTMGFYNQTGGNSLYSYNPHNIRIEASGYDTYSGNFTLSEKVNSNIILQRNYAIGLGSGFILAFILSMGFLAVGVVVFSRSRS